MTSISFNLIPGITVALGPNCCSSIQELANNDNNSKHDKLLIDARLTFFTLNQVEYKKSISKIPTSSLYLSFDCCVSGLCTVSPLHHLTTINRMITVITIITKIVVMTVAETVTITALLVYRADDTDIL